MITGQDPLNSQSRQFVKNVHGVDLAGDPPPDVTPIVNSTFWRSRPRGLARGQRVGAAVR